MKTSVIVCGILAGTLGFASVASAQDWRGRQDRDQRWEQRQDRREARQLRDRQWERQQQVPHEAWRYMAKPAAGYGYAQPREAARYHRGGYLPREYRQSGYYVNNWNAYPGLYAPPSGHQWMNVGSDFLLVALATGLIANLVR